MMVMMMVVVVAVMMYCNGNFRGKYWTGSWPKIVRTTRTSILQGPRLLRELSVFVLSRCGERRLAVIFYTVLLFKYIDILTNLLAAIGLTPHGSSAVYIHTQTVHRPTELTSLVGRLFGIRTQSGQTKMNDSEWGLRLSLDRACVGVRHEHDTRGCRQLCGVPAIDNELNCLLRAKDVWVLERRVDKSEGVKYAVSDVQVDLR